MGVLLPVCWRVYDRSLCCFPADLRERFGDDMSEIFRMQTTEAWMQGGWRALLPVLRCAAKEWITEGLGARATSPAVMAGAVSLVCTTAAYLFLF